MYRILIPTALLIWVALTYRVASAQPLSVVGSLPAIAGLLGLALLAAALYLPKKRARNRTALFLEGKDYLRLKIPQPIASRSGVEVVLVFSYDDPDSYHLEPLMSRWGREHHGDVSLVRTPAMSGAAQQLYARAYYTAGILGLAERLHGALFDTIHIGKQDLADTDRLTGFFAANGADPVAWRKCFGSSAVQTALQKNELFNRGYEVDSTPAIIVNGTFKVTPSMSGTLPRMLEVLDHLAARAGAQSQT